MTLLGFHGVHPLALLVFPVAALVLSAGFVRVFWLRRRLPAWLVWGYPALYAVLAAAGGVWLVKAVYSFNLALLSYAAVLGAFAALYAALELVIWAVGRPWQSTPAFDVSRRKVLAGSVLLLAGPLGAMAAGDRVAADGQVGVRQTVIERSPEALPGRPFKVSLLSDLHAGFFLPDVYMKQALQHIEAFAPDVVLFGGDLIDLELTALKQTRTFLRALCGVAPAYAVLGNHDCYRNSAEVAAFERDCGFKVLRGQSVELSGSHGRFVLCGARDYNESERPEKSLGGGADMASTLLLAHNPGSALALRGANAPWLSLSGHTHGGQIRIPGMGSFVNQADRRLEPGLNRLDGRNIFITAGIGFAGLPVRVFCPPEVANLTIA